MPLINEEMAALMDDEPQVGEDTPSRPKKVIPAPTRSREQSAEPAPEPVKIAEFREFGKGSGALLFGKAAEVVADALQVEQHTTNSDRPRPYVKLTAEQVAAAVPVLEEQGWEVRQKPAEITLHGKSASVRGDAAVAIANEFGFALGATTTGTAKVKFDQGKLEDVIGFLKDQKFVVEVEQAEPSETNKKPVVVFRESLDSDDYKVFDTSAENLAKALGEEPSRTPGGRAIMEVTAKERKQIVRDLGDQLDMSVKPMPEAKLTLYAVGGGNVIGAAATEVAAALNLETESVTRRADGATFPKVTLKEDKIEAAKSALEGLFTIKTEELEPKAIIKTEKEKQEIVVIGAAAPFAATARGVDLSMSQKGNSYVRLPSSDLEFVKSVLKEAGFNEFDISESKPLQRPSQASTSRSQQQAAEPDF